VSPGTGVSSLKVLNGNGQGMVANVLSAVKWVSSGRARTQHTSDQHQPAHPYRHRQMPQHSSTGHHGRCHARGQRPWCSDFCCCRELCCNLTDWRPASLPMVATVTAVDESGQAVASFSNFLDRADPKQIIKTTVLAAPGVRIKSTHFLREHCFWLTRCSVEPPKPALMWQVGNAIIWICGHGVNWFAWMCAAGDGVKVWVLQHSPDPWCTTSQFLSMGWTHATTCRATDAGHMAGGAQTAISWHQFGRSRNLALLTIAAGSTLSTTDMLLWATSTMLAASRRCSS